MRFKLALVDGCLSSLKLYKLHETASLPEHGIFGYLNLWNLCSQIVVPLSSYSDRSLFGLLSECLVEVSPLFSLKAFWSEPLGLPLALYRCFRLWLPRLFLFTFWNFEGILGFVLAVLVFTVFEMFSFVNIRPLSPDIPSQMHNSDFFSAFLWPCQAVSLGILWVPSDKKDTKTKVTPTRECGGIRRDLQNLQGPWSCRETLQTFPMPGSEGPSGRRHLGVKLRKSIPKVAHKSDPTHIP